MKVQCTSFNLGSDIIKDYVILNITLTKLISSLQFLMEEMKLFYQNGQMINTLYVMLIVTSQLKFPASLMFWLIEVFHAIVVLKQKIIFFWNPSLHVIILNLIWLCISL